MYSCILIGQSVIVPAVIGSTDDCDRAFRRSFPQF